MSAIVNFDAILSNLLPAIKLKSRPLSILIVSSVCGMHNGVVCGVCVVCIMVCVWCVCGVCVMCVWCVCGMHNGVCVVCGACVWCVCGVCHTNPATPKPSSYKPCNCPPHRPLHFPPPLHPTLLPVTSSTHQPSPITPISHPSPITPIPNSPL